MSPHECGCIAIGRQFSADFPGRGLGGADRTVELFGGREVPLPQDHLECLGRHAEIDQTLGEAAADVMGTGEFSAVTGPFILLGDPYCRAIHTVP